MNQTTYRGNQRWDWSTDTRPFCSFLALNFHSLKYNDTPFNLAHTWFIPLHCNLKQGHWKVRDNTASPSLIQERRDLKKKFSILLLQLIIPSSISWLYTTKVIQIISYSYTTAWVLPKYNISSCMPSMILSMLAEFPKFCRASPQSSAHTLLSKPFALSFITMFCAYPMLCRSSLGLIAIKHAQRPGFSLRVHMQLSLMLMLAVHLITRRSREIHKST